MKNTIIIKKRYEFKNLLTKGNFIGGKFINLYFRKNKYNYNRLAVAISKKQGKAVVRNHFKRLVKENYKNYEEDLILGYDLLFIVNKNQLLNTKNISFFDIKNNMKKILKKSGIFNEKNID